MIRPDTTRSEGQEAGQYGSANSEFSALMAELKSYQPTASAAARDSLYGSTGADGAHSPARATARCQPLEISTDDWDILFRAVEERLRLSVGAGLSSTAQGRDAAGRVQAIVLECVAELEKLHTALKRERSQHDEG